MTKREPRVHAEVIKAWADGAEIEFFDGDSWQDVVNGPSWSSHTRYRIKPEPKPDIVLESHVYIISERISSRHDHISMNPFRGTPNVRLIFCGDTKQLKDASFISEGDSENK